MKECISESEKVGLSDLAVCSLTLFPPRFIVSSQGRNGCPSSMMAFVLKAPTCGLLFQWVRLLRPVDSSSRLLTLALILSRASPGYSLLESLVLPSLSLLVQRKQ